MDRASATGSGAPRVLLARLHPLLAGGVGGPLARALVSGAGGGAPRHAVQYLKESPAEALILHAEEPP